ncbi:MAG TPA: glycosyl hydrolase [Chitinophagaceae bacterium]|nr:glycosyl hydrolase [Chitinophagaceae bacterium]
MLGFVAVRGQQVSGLESMFLDPPVKSRPYVWWHWMGSNFSKEGITKDLEAMRNMGIGGATIFNIASAVQESHFPILNNPWPNQTYRSDAYWEAIKHAANEAKRLGLEIGLHNTAGYSTTGGPWVTEERAMQKLVWSKTESKGGKPDLLLPKPILPVFEGWGSTKQRAQFYKDVAVLAIPASSNLTTKNILNLTAFLDPQGRVKYKLPKGNWIIYRIGHAPTMANPHPLPDDIIGKSLEVDKMSAEQNTFHWKTVLDPLKEKLGDQLGNSFKHLLIDSYEADMQNWTPAFREEFKKRKGYDPVPWILSFEKDIFINSKEETARFNYDFNDVVNQLFFENGWEIGKKMMKENKLDLQFEPYWGPFNVYQGAALADLPMGEFWTHKVGMLTHVPAAGRTAGKTIIGAEAFTGWPENSQYTEDPAFLKPTATWAFASGINRLILHTWVHQPFEDNYQPGMSMGWWGTHFGRHQTWAEPGKAFFQYLNRSQVMLQYGEQTADYLCLEKQDKDESDIISIQDFLRQKINVVNGQILIASGRTYPFMVLPDTNRILPEVLNKLKILVDAGASLVGPRPLYSYSLKNYPASDEEIKKLANQIWNGKNIYRTVPEALTAFNIMPDVIIESADSAQYIKTLHRVGKEGDVYFIANMYGKPQRLNISFRKTGMQPEIWNAEDGSITNAPVWQEKNGRTTAWLELEDHQSMFIVFRKKYNGAKHPVSITGNVDIDSMGISSSGAGSTTIFYSNGEQRSESLAAPSTQPLAGPWQVKFNPKLEDPFTIEFSSLTDFSQHAEDRVRYFAGTAVYSSAFEFGVIEEHKKYLLDMGTLNDIVSVRLNGKDLGVDWYPPYQMDISSALKKGKNEIEISVTTNWANRLIGDEKQPADFEWGADRDNFGRAMKAFPDWFINKQPRPSKGRKAFLLWYYYRADSKLKPAGMVGPVNILARDIYPL